MALNSTSVIRLVDLLCEGPIEGIVNGKKTNYEIHTLLKICIALDCTPNEIIEKEDFVNKMLKDEYKKKR